jgi:RNA polymerase sigma-70 factor (ECF subfamily)
MHPATPYRVNSNRTAMALEQEIPDTLVRSAQRGDAAAISRLLELSRARVYRWALVQTGAPDDAEDLTQETLLRALRSLHAFAFGARFTTWLHTILRRTTADWRRTKRRRERLLDARSVAESSMQQPEPAAALIDMVRTQLGALTARQREVFDLVDLQGRTPGEAAATLGMNPTTVRVHLLRARRQLRRVILDAHPHIMEDDR